MRSRIFVGAILVASLLLPAAAWQLQAVASSPSMESLRKQIAKHWKIAGSADKRAVVSLKVNDKSPTSVSVCNSSHDDKFDAAAKAAVVSVIPVKVAGYKDGSELRVRFDPFVESVDIYEAEDTDFGPYMANMQRRVKKNWYPPKNKESKHTKVLWKVLSDGTVTKVRVKDSSGDPSVDAAALKAVRTVGKLRPLPAGAPDDVDIEFTFDYNVKGGSSK